MKVGYSLGTEFLFMPHYGPWCLVLFMGVFVWFTYWLESSYPLRVLRDFFHLFCIVCFFWWTSCPYYLFLHSNNFYLNRRKRNVSSICLLRWTMIDLWDLDEDDCQAVCFWDNVIQYRPSLSLWVLRGNNFEAD